MFEKVINILKLKNITIPGYLFFNIDKLGIDYTEFYYLSYILNLENSEFNIEKIAKELSIKPKELLKIINSLSEKGLLKLEIDKATKLEYFNLTGLFNKIALLSIDNVTEVASTLYDEFESVFKRPITPREFQIINAWKETGCTEELILLALKEAEYNKVYNVAYIDKILNNWENKGIKTASDVEKNRENFSKKKEELEASIEDYDWLNE